MAVPRIPRHADTIYWRRDSAGPGKGWDALWTNEVPVSVQRIIDQQGMTDAQIRELGPPLPQIIRNPARLGYPTGQLNMTDIMALRRNPIPFEPVGQDGGGSLATSNPSNYSWW